LEPCHAGKRNWYVIRKYLISAAAKQDCQGSSLADICYIPSYSAPIRKPENRSAPNGANDDGWRPQKGARRLMLAIGEVRKLQRRGYGYKIVLKHRLTFCS